MVYDIKREYVNIFFIYALSVCCIIALSLASFFTPLPARLLTAEPIESELQGSTLTFDPAPFKALEVQAKAYIVYDLSTNNVIAAKNETLRLPLASITKVMTAVSAMLHKRDDTTITITKANIEDGFDLGLKENQRWTLEELLKYTLVFSSNDGAQAIAYNSGGPQNFITQMNNDAALLGLTAKFTDPAGRDLNGNIGGEGTALDAAILFGIARKNIPDLLDATTKKRSTVSASNGRVSGIPNTNQQVEDLPGAEGSKTGFTDLAGGNLGVIVDVTVGHPVVIVVLGSTKEGRFKDVEALYKALRSSIRSN